MALQMIYNLQGDFTIASAYVRVKEIHIEYNPTLAVRLSGGGNKYVALPTLEVKPAKAKNTLDRWTSDRFMFAYDHTINANPIQQAYNFLKTLPEFSVVTDVND